MALFLARPEAGDGEPVLEVRAEIVHPGDREGYVDCELWEWVVSASCRVRKVGMGMYLEDFEVGASEGTEDGVEHGFLRFEVGS